MRLLLLFLIPLIAIYCVLRRVGIKKVEYRRYFSEEGVFEGEMVMLIEEISNRFFLPLIMVDVGICISKDLQFVGHSIEGHGMQEFISRFYLPPFTQITRSVQVICKKRGLYQLESVSINNIQKSAKAVLYVYPQALAYGKSSPMENELLNTAHTNRRLLQDPFSFSGIRNYYPGDTFRSINYKATAKTGTLKVNNRDYFSSRNVMIYIDFAQHYPHPLTTDVYTSLMERSLSYSADMVWESVKQGFSVGFAANCRLLGRTHKSKPISSRFDSTINHTRFPMARGHSHYMEILKEMAAIRMSDGCSFMWLLKQDLDVLWNVDIYIMTTNVSQSFDEVADIFISKGNHVTIIALEDENVIENLA